jgi:hypothetical protein
MQRVGNFIDDIHVEFGLVKCAKTVLKKGELFHLQNLMLDINTEIQEHEYGKTYIYLGIEMSESIQH